MKVYPPEFKADVALYLSDPARTYASVAKDLLLTVRRCACGASSPVGRLGCG
jgi:hypothetical protein